MQFEAAGYTRYTASPRAYPARVPVPEYPGHFTVKQITTGGTFRFGHRVLSLANALTGELVGLDEAAHSARPVAHRLEAPVRTSTPMTRGRPHPPA